MSFQLLQQKAERFFHGGDGIFRLRTEMQVLLE